MALQARRVQQCVALTRSLAGADGNVILSGDDSKELQAIGELYKRLLPNWTVHHEQSVKADETAEQPHKGGTAATKEERQVLEARKRTAFRRIADMREAAHGRALALGVDHLWSLDSDVLPPPNALRCSFDALAWDGGYYSIAFCPYPNDLFLGGFGEPGRPMAEDFLPIERALPPRLRKCLEACYERVKRAGNAKEQRRQARLETKARKYGADGNIWQVTAKHGWRRRGWLDHAYPGIGLGAMVPSTWCGFGCTLMGAQALATADFSGYAGHGTEDIFVIAHRWQPAELKIALLPHCPCDHVLFQTKDGVPTKTYLRAYHEPAGEMRGHLRIERLPWSPAAAAN